MLEGGLGRIAVGRTGRGTPDRDEADRYCGGMCVFSNGNSECSSVKSRVVEIVSEQFLSKITKQSVIRQREGRTYSKWGISRL